MIEAAIEFLAINVGGFVVCVVSCGAGVVGLEMWDAAKRALHR